MSLIIKILLTGIVTALAATAGVTALDGMKWSAAQPSAANWCCEVDGHSA